MTTPPLRTLDSLEILVIVDNEVDPITASYNPAVLQTGGLKELGMNSPFPAPGRGEGAKELRMESICCGAHGLSLMLTAVVGEERHTMLFDTGPEEAAWERNAKRLRPNLHDIELIHLSHWHRDHSGGMLRAIRMINEAKAKVAASTSSSSDAQPTTTTTTTTPLPIDLHPNRPDYRGIKASIPISLEADPSFSEIQQAGGTVSAHAAPHLVLSDTFLISGEIPRGTPYELGVPRGMRFDLSTGSWIEDRLILDERFVMCRLKGMGLVLVTGCSHAGVVNASRHCVRLGNQGGVSGGDGGEGEGKVPLYAVVGGYHLADAEKSVIDVTVRDLKALNPKVLMPGHCTGWRMKMKIEDEMESTLAPSFVGCKYVL